MPNSINVVGVGTVTGRALSVSLIDWKGRQRSTNVVLSADATDTQLNNLSTSIGSASNAALIERNLNNFTRVVNVSDPLVEAFDEAYDNVGWVAVFQFQNNGGDVQTVEVPAPDASLFFPDGETVDPAATLSSGLITQALLALNAGDPAGTYAFSRGYAAQRKVKTSRQRARPTLVEPAGADVPGDAPGV